MAKEKEKEYKFNYFKVNEIILDVEDIKKSELWVYLSHCRSRGIKSLGKKVRDNEVGEKKEVVYSTSALTRVQDFFGNKINKRAYNNAIKSLENKGLIYAIDIEKTGINKRFYKTKKAIEIVEPKDTVNIQLPYELLDNKIFTDMTIKEIKTIIELYKDYNYNINGLGAIDTDCIIAKDTETEKGYCYLNTRFGSGFNRSIYKKKAIGVTDFNHIETELDIDIIQELINKKLFRFKPVVLEYDLEDKDLFELKYELFKNIVGFADEYNCEYILAELEDNKGIIWVLEPTYRVDIKPTRKYFNNYSIAYTRAVLLYTKTDLLTHKKHRRYALYYDETYDMVEGLLDYYEFEEVLGLKEELYDMTGGDPLYTSIQEENLSIIYKQHIKECDDIKEENERLRVEESYRSRSKSSPRLRAIEKEMEELESIVIEEKSIINELEEKLLELIPIETMESFFFESGDYESENIGKVTRLIN